MNRRGAAYRAVITLGIVSLLGDVVYESSRGLVPQYLNLLGASAFVVGVVTGGGELLGLAMRLVSGEIADKKGAYWPLAFLGYSLIVFIPFIAFSWSWQMAAIFILAERLGKAIRSPARDVILSAVSRGLGSGKAFGIHEFFDQLGAVLGPLIVTGIIFFTASHTVAFAFLFCPFFLMMMFLLTARKSIGTAPARRRLEAGEKTGKNFLFYVLAITVSTVAVVPAPLILLKSAALAGGIVWVAPLVYALIQLIDAPSALLAGAAYDRMGARILFIPFVLSAISSSLIIISGDILLMVAAAAVFGVVLGMQESIYRSAVADLTPFSGRGRAYGIFNAVYGGAILVASVIFGAILDLGVPMPVSLTYILSAQLVAILLLRKAVVLGA